MDKANFILERRFGRFKIARAVVVNDPHKFLAIMGHCLITRAETRWIDDVVEYEASSPLFRPVESGCEVPEYTFSVVDGVVKASAPYPNLGG